MNDDSNEPARIQALVPDSSGKPAPLYPGGGPISAPVEQTGVNHMALNCIVPGLGSLVRGRKGLGAGQLALFGGGILILLSGQILFGILMAVAAYAWSIASGVGFVRSQGRLSW